MNWKVRMILVYILPRVVNRNGSKWRYFRFAAGREEVADDFIIDTPPLSSTVVEDDPRKGCETAVTTTTVNPLYSDFGCLATSTNPFIVFFLRLCNRKPRKNVTKIARVAGKRWQEMNPEQRQKYVDIAKAEKKRRVRQKRRLRQRRNRRNRKFKLVPDLGIILFFTLYNEILLVTPPHLCSPKNFQSNSNI
jgi:hypothetical protein